MKRKKLYIVTANIPDALVKGLDKLVELRGFRSRSEAIRLAILRLLRDELYIRGNPGDYSTERMAKELMDNIIKLARGQVSKGKWYSCRYIYPEFIRISRGRTRTGVAAPWITVCIELLKELGFTVEKKRAHKGTSKVWHFYLDLDDLCSD